MREEWRARDEDLDAIAAARKSDPFAVLGPHQTAAGWVIRVFAPEAISVRALTRDGALMAELPRRKDDFFEALIPSAKQRPAYRVEVETAHGAFSYIDPYAFGPALGPLDDYLGGRARIAALPLAWRPAHSSRRRRRGALRGMGAECDARFGGRRFQSVGRPALQMRRRFDSGLWEIFVPELTAERSINSSS